MQSEKAFGGNLESNRIGFYPMYAENVVISVNDQHKPYKLGYQLKYNDENVLKDCVEAFVGLYQETGQTSGHNEITIKPDQFAVGYTFFVYDISKTHSSSGFNPGLANFGSCTLKVTFRKQALTDNVVIYRLLMYQKSYVLQELKGEIRDIDFYETTK